MVCASFAAVKWLIFLVFSKVYGVSSTYKQTVKVRKSAV
jgi:hypothetical protein